MIDMTLNELKDKLKTETERIEWKESTSDTSKIFQAVCALANDLGHSRQPGFLLVGVKKNGSVVGLGPLTTSIDEEMQAWSNRLRSTKILPTPVVSIEPIEYELNKVVLAFTIQPYPVPPIVTVDGTAWIRSGSTTTKARDAELVRLRERRHDGHQAFDTRVQRLGTLDDLNLVPLREEYLTAKDIDAAPDTFPSFEEWLTQRQLGHVVDGRWHPNNAAILLFGRSPQSFIPGATVEFVRYGGTTIDAPVSARRVASGTLPDQLQVIWAQLNAHNSSVPVATDGIRSPFTNLYPIDVLKELARNIVQHRQYDSTNAPSRIEWYDDRIEFSNPGGPFGRASEGLFGSHSDYRNPLITKALAEEGYVEHLGRGVRLARSLLKKNGNPDLEVEVDGYTRVIVRRPE